jgi:hypothetical protein
LGRTISALAGHVSVCASANECRPLSDRCQAAADRRLLLLRHSRRAQPRSRQREIPCDRRLHARSMRGIFNKQRFSGLIAKKETNSIIDYTLIKFRNNIGHQCSLFIKWEEPKAGIYCSVWRVYIEFSSPSITILMLVFRHLGRCAISSRECYIVVREPAGEMAGGGQV